MFPMWLFHPPVPDTHVEVLESLARRASPECQVAWAYNPASSDEFTIHALATAPVAALRELDAQMLPPTVVSNGVVDGLLAAKKKRLTVFRWVARQHLSEAAARRLAAWNPAVAEEILACRTTTEAVGDAVVSYGHGPAAARWMLHRADFRQVDTLDLSQLTGFEGSFLLAMLGAYLPERFDWLRSGGESGDWMAAASLQLTLPVAEEIVARRPGTIRSLVWNPRLSCDQAAHLIDQVDHELIATRMAAQDALTNRRNWHDHHTDDPATESDPEVLRWLIHRSIDLREHPSHRSSLPTLLANPHVDDHLREFVATRLDTTWGLTPEPFNRWCAQLLAGHADRADLTRGSRPAMARPVHTLDLGWDRRSVQYCERDAVAHLCAALPPDPQVWEVASVLWGTLPPDLTWQEFIATVQSTC